MIELMLKNIFENSNKIDCIVNHLNKTNKIYALDFILITLGLFATTKAIKKQKIKISELERKLEEIKSIVT